MATLLFIILKLTETCSISWWWIILILILDDEYRNQIRGKVLKKQNKR